MVAGFAAADFFDEEADFLLVMSLTWGRPFDPRKYRIWGAPLKRGDPAETLRVFHRHVGHEPPHKSAVYLPANDESSRIFCGSGGGPGAGNRGQHGHFQRGRGGAATG